MSSWWRLRKKLAGQADPSPSGFRGRRIPRPQRGRFPHRGLQYAAAFQSTRSGGMNRRLAQAAHLPGGFGMVMRPYPSPIARSIQRACEIFCWALVGVEACSLSDGTFAKADTRPNPRAAGLWRPPLNSVTYQVVSAGNPRALQIPGWFVQRGVCTLCGAARHRYQAGFEPPL